MSMKKITKKVGNSLMITLDMDTRKIYNIEEGDAVEFDIVGVEKRQEEEKEEEGEDEEE